MRRMALIVAALALGNLASAASAQVRVPRIIERVIPGNRGRQPPPPQLVGIEALRADFIMKSGSDAIYFGGDSFILSPPARATLAAQAQWLMQNPQVVVRIEGHADAGDTRDHAFAIGQRRADAVRDYLVLLGVPAAQVAAVSLGKERPAMPGNSDAALARSRRAVTVLVR